MRFTSILAFLLCGASVSAAAEDDKSELAKPYQTNVEMTAIFDADQAARRGSKVDWTVVEKEDRSRRARTQTLLDSGQLNSGDDFYHAAFIFQHGDLPEDYLKAHAVAVIAAARGKSDATWTAAATLDRYLQRIGQSQIYGTQYLRSGQQGWTQEPYRRDLLSDALREASYVPPIKEQQDELKDMAGKSP